MRNSPPRVLTFGGECFILYMVRAIIIGISLLKLFFLRNLQMKSEINDDKALTIGVDCIGVCPEHCSAGVDSG